MMKSQIGHLLGVCFAIFLSTVSQAYAASEGWHFQKYGKDVGGLFYGEKGNEENLVIDFACDRSSGTVGVLMREVSTRVKPGDRLCVVATGEKGESDLCGVAIPNELAGVPDFEAIVSPRLPLFATVDDESKALTIKFRETTSIIPLEGFNKAAKKFAKLCYGTAK